MLEAVLVFAAITMAFETVVLMKIKPRTRCYVLGSDWLVLLIHAIAFGANLAIHYGSVTGSMTAITAALTSFITVPLIRKFSGYTHKGVYHPGWRNYPATLVR